MIFPPPCRSPEWPPGTGVELSIMGAATRNVDGKAFGTMLVTLPEDEGKTREILDFLNSCTGVRAEEVTEHV